MCSVCVSIVKKKHFIAFIAFVARECMSSKNVEAAFFAQWLRVFRVQTAYGIVCFRVIIEVTTQTAGHENQENQRLWVLDLEKYGLKAARRAPQFSKR